MVNYKPYSYYRSSRIEWLGDIPVHWEETKFKFIGNLILGLTYSPNDVVGEDAGGTLVLRSSNVQNGRIELKDCVFVSNTIPKKLITTKRDVLICSRNGSRSLIGKCAVIDDSVCGQTFGAFMTVFRTQYTKFAYYILNSSLFKFQSGRFLTSTINQLTTETLGGFDIPLPPLNEQQTIACFLDFKTTQIDKLITKKQTLLDKLSEKRIALISYAVTKGLDPSVPMKDSGVEWLGSIPQDWKETRIKFLGELILGLTYSPDDVVSDSGTLVLRSSNVQDGKVSLNDCVYVSCDVPKKVITKVDDILICSRNGSRALIGKCALLTEEVSNQAFGAFMTVLRSRHARFLYYVLNSTLFKFQSGRFLTSTINQLTTQTLGDFEIALPSEETQAEIVNHLDKATAAIDAQCSKVQSAIDRLAEYRAALITNAVTGKIDVRGFVIPKLEGTAL